MAASAVAVQCRRGHWLTAIVFYGIRTSLMLSWNSMNSWKGRAELNSREGRKTARRYLLMGVSQTCFTLHCSCKVWIFYSFFLRTRTENLKIYIYILHVYNSVLISDCFLYILHNSQSKHQYIVLVLTCVSIRLTSWLGLRYQNNVTLRSNELTLKEDVCWLRKNKTMPCESWLNGPATGRCVYLSHSLNTVPEGLRWSDKPPRDRPSIQQPLRAILLLCVCVSEVRLGKCVCVCVLMSWDDMFALCPNAYMFVCDVHVNAHVKTFIYELAVHVSRPTVLDSVPCICICVCES